MDDRYSYPPNYPPRNDLITDFGALAALDSMDSMSSYIYSSPTQYNPYHYGPPVSAPPSNSSLYSPHSTSSSSGIGDGSGINAGSGSGSDLNPDSFYSSSGSDDPFSDEPPLLEELGINFDQIMQKAMVMGNHFTPNTNNKPEPNLIHESDLNDLLIDKEENASTRSPILPPSNETSLDSNHHHLSSSETINYGDDRSVQVLYSDNSQTSNHVCDNLPNSSANPHGGSSNVSRGGNGNGNGGNVDPGQVNRPDSQENSPSINSWDKPLPDELNYPFDSRHRAPNRFNSIPSNLAHNLNGTPPHIPKLHPIGHQFVPGLPPRTSMNYNQHHRQLMPTLQPIQPATIAAYPYQRPVPIQPNLGYASHKMTSQYTRFLANVDGRNMIFWTRPPLGSKIYPSPVPIAPSPGSHHPQHLGPASLSHIQDATNPNASLHGRLPIMSLGRVAFTSSPLDDASSPSSSCSTSSSTSPTGGLMDKKLYMNNPLLVNMLTCAQMPGLRNLAPAPDSSSSHLEEKSKSEILSGLVEVSGEKRKRSNRAVATTTREPVKREMRPKIFDIEQFKIGLFQVQSSNEGTRRNSSTQLKVIFSKRRFIYEFAFSGSYTYDCKRDQHGSLSIQPSSIGYRCTNTNSCGSGNGTNVSSVTSNMPRIQSTNNTTNNVGAPVVYYVIAVPFDTITGLNIDESTMYLTVDRVPFLFGGTSVRSKVQFEKAPQFDPSQGEIESNSLHCISLRSSQVGRLRTSLVEFDKRFAELLSNKMDRDPFTYRCKLIETSKDSKEEDKTLSDRQMVNNHLHHHQHQLHHHTPQQQQQQQQSQPQNHQLPDSGQPLKKQKLINKVD